ncbi:MAG: tetratricopeptide repeat protein [candidate division NC10 bacterium]
MGRLQDALATYQLAEGFYPKDINILSDLAYLLHRVELDDRARPFYERVLKIHPNNAAAHMGLGEILYKQGLLESAQRHFESALVEWKSNETIWREYAQVLGERRDWGGAIRAIQRALALQENASSMEALAVFQRHIGAPAGYATLRRACDLTGKSGKAADIKLRLGLWLLEDGRLDESLQEAQAVLSERPEEPLALWLMASVKLRQGRLDEARRDLASAAQAGRSSQFVARTAAAMLRQMEDR